MKKACKNCIYAHKNITTASTGTYLCEKLLKSIKVDVPQDFYCSNFQSRKKENKIKGKTFPLGYREKWRFSRLVIATGEYRKPKRGEWFISGAKPEGYKATNDMSVKYHIAELLEKGEN